MSAQKEVLGQVLRIAKDFRLLNPKMTDEQAMWVAKLDFRRQMMVETREWKKQNLSPEYQLKDTDRQITEIAKRIKKKFGL